MTPPSTFNIYIWQDLVISSLLQHLQSSAYVGSSFCRQIRAGEVYGGVDAGPLNEENEKQRLHLQHFGPGKAAKETLHELTFV